MAFGTIALVLSQVTVAKSNMEEAARSVASIKAQQHLLMDPKGGGGDKIAKLEEQLNSETTRLKFWEQTLEVLKSLLGPLYDIGKAIIEYLKLRVT